MKQHQVPCEKCGAKEGQPCFTVNNKPTQPHTARVRRYALWIKQERAIERELAKRIWFEQ